MKPWNFQNGQKIKENDKLYITDYSGYIYKVNPTTKEITKTSSGTGTTWITSNGEKLWVSVSPYNEINYLKIINNDKIENEIELEKKNAGFIMYIDN